MRAVWSLEFTRPRAFFWSLFFVCFKALIFVIAYWKVSSDGAVNLYAWDANYYREIVENGYASFSKQQSNLAFFPVFPLLVKAIVSLGGWSVSSAAIGLNLVLFGCVTFLLMEWGVELGFRKYFYLPALLLTVDRFTLWSHVPYTEALFASTILAFMLILRKRIGGKYHEFLAALVGGLASGVRIVGVSLIAGLGIARLRSYLKNPFKGAVLLALGILGVLCFFVYLHFSQGMWNASLKTTANWGRYFEISGFFKSFWYLVKSAYFPTLLLLFLSLFFLIRPPRDVPLSGSERITFAFLLFIPMASSIQASLTRYLSVLLVGYVAWAWLLLKMQKHRQIWVYLWILVMVFEIYWQIHLTMKFFRGEVFQWAC